MQDTTSTVDRQPNKSLLPHLATEIDQLHDECKEAQRTAAETARDCGRRLLEAKAIVPHGKWKKWLQENVQPSQRTAERYMLIARRWDDIQKAAGAKTTRASILTIREALRLLTTNQPVDVDFHTQLCPNCRSEIVNTSQYWATCINCWDCRLYGVERSNFSHFRQKGMIQNIGQILDSLDKDERLALLKKIEAELKVTEAGQ